MRASIAAAGGLSALLLILTGCAAGTPSTGAAHESGLSHVHSIVTTHPEDGYLLGTHEGIYPIEADGTLGKRLGGWEFDAMGLTALGDDLIASGHPGARTPVEWGSPNIGIIRSSDGGQKWQPIAFTGEKDFHALAAAPSGRLYGLATDSAQLQISSDAGQSWATGATIPAFALAADANGRLIAATPEGLETSADEGVTFTDWAGAPILGVLAASPDGQWLVGVGAQNKIWRASARDEWQTVATAHGTAQAIGITDAGAIALVDDSGFSVLAP